MHAKLAKLKKKPDIVIIYCGHNEFQARFSWLKIVPYYNDEFPPIPTRASCSPRRVGSRP